MGSASRSPQLAVPTRSGCHLILSGPKKGAIMYQVEQNENGLTVSAPARDVVARLKVADWGWKTSWRKSASGGDVLEVQGHFLKDNAAASNLEILSLSDGRTAIYVEGNRGKAMNAIGGNIFNTGVKRFQKKVLEKAQKILSGA